MNMYTIKEIQKNIMNLDESYSLFGSLTDEENLYLLFNKAVPKINHMFTIKVCWVNNMRAIYKEDNVHIISVCDKLEPTQIDEEHHLFEIIKLEKDMTEEDYKCIAKKLEEACRDE